MQSYTNLNQCKMKSVETFVEKNNYQINKLTTSQLIQMFSYFKHLFSSLREIMNINKQTSVKNNFH
ncbi:hypothetical protein DOY81_010933 [Sarcophaga bullata]|nr:hypothetical protein DOY81_010933 [Sarcophaga bullata]